MEVQLELCFKSEVPEFITVSVGSGSLGVDQPSREEFRLKQQGVEQEANQSTRLGWAGLAACSGWFERGVFTSMFVAAGISDKIQIYRNFL